MASHSFFMPPLGSEYREKLRIDEVGEPGRLIAEE